jgi:hypothetical protein
MVEPVAMTMRPASTRSTVPSVPLDHEQMIAGKRASAHHPLLGRPVLDRLDDEAHEAVALALDALHHRPAVDLGRSPSRRRRRRLLDHVRRLGRGDQQLGRHAADPRAGRAVLRTLDQQHALGCLPRRAKRPHAGRAGADHQRRRPAARSSLSSSLMAAA